MGKKSRKSRQVKPARVSNGGSAQARPEADADEQSQGAEIMGESARARGGAVASAVAAGVASIDDQPMESGLAVLGRLAVLVAIPTLICLVVKIIFE